MTAPARSVFAEPLAQVREALEHNAKASAQRSDDPDWPRYLTEQEQDALAALDLIEQRATDMESLTEFRCGHEHRWWMAANETPRRCPMCNTITFSEVAQ